MNEGSMESVDKHIKKVKYNHSVDEDTIQVGRNTKKVSSKDTKRMLEQRIDTLPAGSEERKVYEKIYKGNQQFN